MLDIVSPDMEVFRRKKEGGAGHESYPCPGEHVITHILTCHDASLLHVVPDDREVWHEIVTSLSEMASNSHLFKLKH